MKTFLHRIPGLVFLYMSVTAPWVSGAQLLNLYVFDRQDKIEVVFQLDEPIVSLIDTDLDSRQVFVRFEDTDIDIQGIQPFSYERNPFVESVTFLPENAHRKGYSFQGRIIQIARIKLRSPFRVSTYKIEKPHGIVLEFLELETEIKRFPQDDESLSPAYYSCGLHEKSQGRIDKALMFFRRSIQAYERVADSHFQIGMILYQEGRSEMAGISFKEALKSPAHGDLARLYICWICYNSGNLAELRRHWKEFLNRVPDRRARSRMAGQHPDIDYENMAFAAQEDRGADGSSTVSSPGTEKVSRVGLAAAPEGDSPARGPQEPPVALGPVPLTGAEIKAPAEELTEIITGTASGRTSKSAEEGGNPAEKENHTGGAEGETVEKGYGKISLIDSSESQARSEEKSPAVVSVPEKAMPETDSNQWEKTFPDRMDKEHKGDNQKADSHFFAGIISYRDGHFERAWSNFTVALNSDQYGDQARLYLCWIYYKTGNMPYFRRSWSKFLARVPDWQSRIELAGLHLDIDYEQLASAAGGDSGQETVSISDSGHRRILGNLDDLPGGRNVDLFSAPILDSEDESLEGTESLQEDVIIPGKQENELPAGLKLESGEQADTQYADSGRMLPQTDTEPVITGTGEITGSDEDRPKGTVPIAGDDRDVRDIPTVPELLAGSPDETQPAVHEAGKDEDDPIPLIPRTMQAAGKQESLQDGSSERGSTDEQAADTTQGQMDIIDSGPEKYVEQQIAEIHSVTVSDTAGEPAEYGDSAQEGYVLGNGDIVRINVLDEIELSGKFKISSLGKISYPFLGNIDVSGMTVEELNLFITGELQKNYLVNPVVTMSVESYRSKKVLVQGEVIKPGVYYLEEKTDVLSLILGAGGTTKDASEQIMVLRSEGGPSDEADKENKFQQIKINLKELFSGDPRQNIKVRSNDIIFVANASGGQFRTEGRLVNVIGEIKKPGSYDYRIGLTVLDVILEAGGFTEYANKNKVKIIRRSSDGRKIVIAKLNNLINKGKLEEDILLEPGDLVVIPQSFF